MESILFNPAVAVPLGAFLVAIVAIISGTVSKAHSSRLRAEQRMALLARGVPISEIEGLLQTERIEDPLPSSPARRMGASRKAAMVLISVGFGLIAFGIVLTAIEHDREVFTVAAAGLIPLAIGIGFFVDYSMQRKDMERFGLAAEDERKLR
jgi:hypothetical protein